MLGTVWLWLARSCVIIWGAQTELDQKDHEIEALKTRIEFLEHGELPLEEFNVL